MKNEKLEFAVGLFVLLGVVALGWLSVKLGRMELIGDHYIPLHATFTSISGLKRGASVEIAGVEIGRVDTIALKPGDYEADVMLKIQGNVPIQSDAIASVRTKGLIGDRFIKISPGGSDQILKAGETITQTEPAISFEELMSQFIHGSMDSKKP